MPERFSEYTAKVCAKLRWKKVRPLVKEELEAHLAESGEARGSGEAAIAAMGSPEETGERLNGLYKPRVDAILLIGVGLLIALSALIVPIGEWILYTLGVLALGAAFVFIDVRRLLQRYGLYIFLAGALALVLVPLPFFTPVINGARRWLPANFAGSFPCICGMGAMLGDGRDVKRPLTILYILALTAIPCLAILVMPHFSMLVMFGFSMWAMYFRSKMPRAFVWWLPVIGLLLCILIAVQAEYRAQRLTALFYPWDLDPLGIGYYPRVIREAWISAEWLGPATLEPHVANLLFNNLSDSALAGFAAVAGKLPAYLVIALNALVVWRMLTLARRLQDRLSSIVSFGASALMALMSAIGILSNFGWLLSGGQPMFLSESGAYWLLQGACVSIVFALNMNRDYIHLSQGSKPDAESVRRRLRIRIEWTK